MPQPSPYDSSSPYADFWNKMGPGLFDLGTNLFNRSQGSRDSTSLLSASRGPVYDPAMSASAGMLGQAGNFDPQAFAADRFKASQALVQPVQDRNLDKLMAELRGKGQLGISTYNPGVEGITPNGTAMNPQLAAFYAAQNADNAKRAEASVGQGQGYLDNLVKRSGMLSDQANRVQTSGVNAQQVAGPASRGASNLQLIKGVGGILKDTGVLGKIGGMLGSGVNWLGDKTGLWGGTPDPWKMSSFTDYGGNNDWGGYYG